MRVSLATRLFESEVDEQLIMSCIGHSSTDGYVHAYKQTSDKLKEITADLLSATSNVARSKPVITKSQNLSLKLLCHLSSISVQTKKILAHCLSPKLLCHL